MRTILLPIILILLLVGMQLWYTYCHSPDYKGYNYEREYTSR